MELDRVYTFECAASFGTLPQSVVNTLFTDGRHAAGFLERQLEVWFPVLKFMDGRGFDHQDEQGVRYEAKCFTPRGADYSASKFKGAGRRINLTEHAETAKQLIYIMCDVVDFPVVHVLFKRGETLLARYPNGKIPFNQRSQLFIAGDTC
jgi:hypothetical protein